MNPLDEDSWKCSKLLLRPNFHKTKKRYRFNLLWIAPSQVMNGLEPIKGKSYTKEICRSYVYILQYIKFVDYVNESL